jgi:hypothetical protein
LVRWQSKRLKEKQVPGQGTLTGNHVVSMMVTLILDNVIRKDIPGERMFRENSRMISLTRSQGD